MRKNSFVYFVLAIISIAATLVIGCGKAEDPSRAGLAPGDIVVTRPMPARFKGGKSKTPPTLDANGP